MLPDWLTDVASVATLIGLGLTFWQSYQARAASEFARTEVASFRTALALHDLAADCAAATEALEAILQDHREGKWDRLEYRYDSLRKRLARVVEAGSENMGRDRALIHEALIQVVRIAERLDEREHEPIAPAEAVDLTKQAARQRDKLSLLVGRLRHRVGEKRE